VLFRSIQAQDADFTLPLFERLQLAQTKGALPQMVNDLASGSESE